MTTDRHLYREDVAALVGIRVDSLQRANLPPRDGTDVQSGKARPWWSEATIRSWLAARPGRGARTDLDRAS